MPRKVIRRSSPAADMPAPAPEPTPEPTPTPDPTPMNRSRKRKASSPFPALVLVLVVACVGYACFKYFPASNKGATKAAAAAADQVADLVSKVSKHIAIKEGETPLIAIVQDPETLRVQNPLFYKDAQSGDRLLIWSDKAVLYSTSRDIVLAMAPLNGSASSVQPGTGTPAPAAKNPSKDKVTLELRNGSGTPGLARKAADKLKADGWNVVTVTDAKMKDVQASEVLASKTGSFGTLPADLAKIVNGVVTSAINGEPASAADILVIIGSDYQP